jgi:hypothetical protein
LLAKHFAFFVSLARHLLQIGLAISFRTLLETNPVYFSRKSLITDGGVMALRFFAGGENDANAEHSGEYKH